MAIIEVNNLVKKYRIIEKEEGIKGYFKHLIKPKYKEFNAVNGINFNIGTPFEDFGSDVESYTNTSFSDYYKELLEKFNLKVDNIQTESRSDGKYTITINDEEFDIVAWDGLSEVIDNVDSMFQVLTKNKESEMEI